MAATATDSPDLGWLSPTNTAKALDANPGIKSDLSNMLAASGDKRTPGQWLYDDLKGGDTNQAFKNITMQASGLFGDFFGNLLPDGNLANPPVTAPTGPMDTFTPPGSTNSKEDEGGIFNQIKDMFLGVVGILGKPSSTVVNAPVTNTSVEENLSVDNSQTFYDYSQDNRSTTNYDSITYGFGANEIGALMDRITTLLSVPLGGNAVISPSSPPTGYAQNVEQSGPRLGGQTIASVGGLELNTAGVGIGGTGIPWRTIILSAVASLVVFLAYKKFFRK